MSVIDVEEVPLLPIPVTESGAWRVPSDALDALGAGVRARAMGAPGSGSTDRCGSADWCCMRVCLSARVRMSAPSMRMSVLCPKHILYLYVYSVCACCVSVRLGTRIRPGALLIWG